MEVRWASDRGGGASTAETRHNEISAKLGPDPLHEAKGQAWQDYRAKIAVEQADIPDPYEVEVDPETLFAWREDMVNRTVAIAAADQTPRSQAAFKAAEQVLGLNRDELLHHRFATYRNAAIIAEAVRSTDPVLVSMGRARAGEMVSASADYAGMVRWYFRRWDVAFTLP